MQSRPDDESFDPMEDEELDLFEGETPAPPAVTPINTPAPVPTQAVSAAAQNNDGTSSPPSLSQAIAAVTSEAEMRGETLLNLIEQAAPLYTTEKAIFEVLYDNSNGAQKQGAQRTTAINNFRKYKQVALDARAQETGVATAKVKSDFEARICGLQGRRPINRGKPKAGPGRPARNKRKSRKGTSPSPDNDDEENEEEEEEEAPAPKRKRPSKLAAPPPAAAPEPKRKRGRPRTRPVTPPPPSDDDEDVEMVISDDGSLGEGLEQHVEEDEVEDDPVDQDMPPVAEDVNAGHYPWGALLVPYGNVLHAPPATNAGVFVDTYQPSEDTLDEVALQIDGIQEVQNSDDYQPPTIAEAADYWSRISLPHRDSAFDQMLFVEAPQAAIEHELTFHWLLLRPAMLDIINLWAPHTAEAYSHMSRERYTMETTQEWTRVNRSFEALYGDGSVYQRFRDGAHPWSADPDVSVTIERGVGEADEDDRVGRGEPIFE